MDHSARVKQLDIIDEAQQKIDEGPNSEQTHSIVQEAQSVQAAPNSARRVTVERPSALDLSNANAKR